MFFGPQDTTALLDHVHIRLTFLHDRAIVGICRWKAEFYSNLKNVSHFWIPGSTTKREDCSFLVFFCFDRVLKKKKWENMAGMALQLMEAWQW